MAEVQFPVNALREFQPELALRVEQEITEGAAEEEGRLECRVTERQAERALIAVHIEGPGWGVGFSVSTPPAAGEIRVETRKALRDRGRRVPNYRRSARRS